MQRQFVVIVAKLRAVRDAGQTYQVVLFEYIGKAAQFDLTQAIVDHGHATNAPGLQDDVTVIKRLVIDEVRHEHGVIVVAARDPVLRHAKVVDRRYQRIGL